MPKAVNPIGPQVAGRLHGQQLLVAYSGQASIQASLQFLATADTEKEIDRAQLSHNIRLQTFGLPIEDASIDGGERSAVRKPFAYSNGYAIIPITGMLINRFGWSWNDYVTGYNFIRAQMNAALADPDVTAIFFDINTYGGEVAGCFELSDDIFNARGQKPLIGVIDSNCYSAGMMVGSACDKLIITPTGGAGSIGVVTCHTNYGKAYEDYGIEVEFVFSGDHKVDGNPFEGLSDEVRAAYQARVDLTRDKFVNLMSRNLNIDRQVVYDTQAACYNAEDALKLGLVHAIAPPSKAVETYINELSGSTTENELESDDMPAPIKQDDQEANTQAATDLAVKTAVAADRKRTADIMALPESDGRKDLANHLAMNTSMTVDEVKASLAVSPKAEATKPNAFQQAMDNSPSPKVGSDDASGESGDETMSMAHQMLRDQNAATGTKHAIAQK